MAIFRGSRYENLQFTTIIEEDGSEKKFLHLRDNLTIDDLDDQFNIERAIEGDEYDSIAYDTGNSPFKWWVLAEVNEEPFAFDLENGDIVVIPTQTIFSNPNPEN